MEELEKSDFSITLVAMFSVSKTSFILSNGLHCTKKFTIDDEQVIDEFFCTECCDLFFNFCKMRDFVGKMKVVIIFMYFYIFLNIFCYIFCKYIFYFHKYILLS